MTGVRTRSDAIDEMVKGETMVKRSQLMRSGGKIVPAVDPNRKRESKAEEKRERREKRVCEVLMEHERKIAGKTNCLQSQGRSFL